MKNRVLFINSFQRSGSTLLGLLLDYHSDITYLGEVRNVHQYLIEKKTCFSGELLNKCAFWSEMFNHLNEDSNKMITKYQLSLISRIIKRALRKVDSNILHKIFNEFSYTRKKELQSYKNIRKYYSTCKELSNTSWTVDSSHITDEARNHIEALKNDMKVVFLIRDGRGVINSVMKRTGQSSLIATKNWKRFIKDACKFHNTLSNKQILYVRYEDICSNTFYELNRIATFMDILPFDNSFNKMNKEHHCIGGSSTLRSRKSNPTDINLDEKWKNSLKEEDLLVFEKIAGNLNRSFGYL